MKQKKHTKIGRKIPVNPIISIMIVVSVSVIVCMTVSADGKESFLTGITADNLSVNDRESYVPGEIIVQYDTRMYTGTSDTITFSPENIIAGADTLLDYTPAGISGLYLLSIPDTVSVPQAVSRYEQQPGVVYAEPNYYVYAAVLPNDPDFTLQWGLSNTGQIINGIPGMRGCDVSAPDAWDISTGSKEQVVIALLDSGVDLTHPDLIPNLWTDPLRGTHGYDVIDNDYIPMDLNGHGTHCAGIIGAVGNNQLGVCGINWETRIMTVRFLNGGGAGTISGVLSAITWAQENDAEIISCSFVTDSYSQALYDTISSSPLLFICAAGNNHCNIDATPYYPASFTCPNIISVGSINNQGTLAPSSNYGIISVDLAAPGVDIYSTTLQTAGSGYTYMSGTSMAVPFVSGSVAILKAICPDCSNQKITDAICNTVDTSPDLVGYTKTGGRLNLSKAVTALGPVNPDYGDLFLSGGWNFISVPKVLQPGQDTAIIFSNVVTNGHSLLTYTDNQWRAVKSDEKIVPLQGYWIFSENPHTIRLFFERDPQTLPTRQIHAGWEAVGYYGTSTKTSCTAFSSIQNIWRFLIGYDAVNQRYSDLIENTCLTFDPGVSVFPYHGYWLYSDSSGILTS
ncbi:MAG: S8 family serine peptidase [Methanospirillaceae archaeon]|nr:S8 family serine peptidase [Methanospirillaceae archaeon]